MMAGVRGYCTAVLLVLGLALLAGCGGGEKHKDSNRNLDRPQPIKTEAK